MGMKPVLNEGQQSVTGTVTNPKHVDDNASIPGTVTTKKSTGTGTVPNTLSDKKGA